MFCTASLHHKPSAKVLVIRVLREVNKHLRLLCAPEFEQFERKIPEKYVIRSQKLQTRSSFAGKPGFRSDVYRQNWHVFQEREKKSQFEQNFASKTILELRRKYQNPLLTQTFQKSMFGFSNKNVSPENCCVLQVLPKLLSFLVSLKDFKMKIGNILKWLIPLWILRCYLYVK